MISLTTIIMAAVFTVILLLVSLFVPNPITWVMTLILGALLYFVLWPQYQGQQQAVRQGVEIQAAVQEVRHWNRKQSDTTVDRYEIIAVAPNPNTGNIQQFVSPPMAEDPAPYVGDSVKVTVDWSNPKAYVMDVSFLPFKVE
ncbi:hypothetical protein LVJ83_01250 [Uruburuella testudinis]|uniref:Uncharacterized protein n=1 Tax=Uruburuella testudinis TaxID=1282863 RepID=A0ABY4DSX4_9NEIS|nr:hypothetical protein [Uruburuella testudinis]UOO82135.1 hypothetical protein LVJ83_01250 [Uruburuella testudinis]